jgi:exodeoxyribonuclease VII small subunit
MMTKRKAKAADELPYEKAFEDLEEVVAKLEQEDLPLEDAIALFERGQALSTRCNSLLAQAELKLRVLAPDEEGGYQEDDFELEEEG